MENKFVLIDGNSLINRAFYALPPLSQSDGTPVQGVYGFATMLIKAITDVKPDYIAVAFDLPAPTFRHKKYTEYKAQRKGMPDDLAVQLPILKDMLRTMGITILELSGFEADDIIGTMAKRAKCKTFIVTGDKDSLQLIDDKINVMLTKKGLSEILLVDPESMLKEFSITAGQVVDYKALCGDTSDNIPGVAGIGDKTATTLINTYGSLDGVYQNIDSIAGKLKEKLEEGKDKAYLSQFLATIDTAVALDCAETDCKYNFPFDFKVKRFFIDKGFKSLVKRDEIFDVSKDADIAENDKLNDIKKPVCQIIEIKSAAELKNILDKNIHTSKVAFEFTENAINFSFGYAAEFTINIAYSLLGEGLNRGEIINCLKPILANDKIQKVLFDCKATKYRLLYDNVQINNYSDVKLLQYLVDMQINYDSIEEFLGEYDIDKKEAASGLLFISNSLIIELEKLNMHKLYYDIELPLSDILFRMERQGFKVDLAKLAELGKTFSQKQSELAKSICADAGREFNVNSPKQLGKVLFEDMQIPYPQRGKNHSTNAEILEQLEAKYPIARKILDYRFYAKLSSTYIEGLKKLADSNGIVHTEFKQTLTTTGRLSSVEPNLQNIPVRQEEGRLLRGVFVASEGNTLVSADYSQIELRLMAHLSGDGKMISAYRNGEDIHTSTAAEVFGVDKSEVTPSMRRDAKAVNFGIIYGMSEYGLSLNLNITPQKAKEYIAKYFERFPGVKSYLDKSVLSAKEKGYAVSVFNRIRKIPELVSSNFKVRQFGERAAMNMPLQASAADIIKIAMIEVDKALAGMKSKLILQVHDELIVDADESEIDEVKAILKNKMENAVGLSVPLTVDIGVGKTWFDCK